MTDNDIQAMFAERDRSEDAGEADRIDCLIDNALRKQFSERQRARRAEERRSDAEALLLEYLQGPVNDSVEFDLRAWETRVKSFLSEQRRDMNDGKGKP